MRNDVAAPAPVLEAGLDVDAAIQVRRPRILAAVRDSVGGRLQELDEGWEASLLDAFVAELHGQPSGAFTDQVNGLLDASVEAGGTGNAWQPAFAVLRRELIPCLVADSEMRSHAEDLLQEARSMVGDVVEHTHAQRRLGLERRSRTLAETAEAMAAAIDLESLGRILDERLPAIGVPGAFIVLYGRGASAAPEVHLQLDPRSAERRLVVAHDPRRQAPFVEGGLAFPGSALLPEAVSLDDRRRALVVEPLFFKDDPLGYVAFELGPFDGLIYESLREQISWVLKVALLIDQLVATGTERATLLADLQVRAGQLEAAYRALQDNQQRLLSAEKMAALGRITANIAHEMSTPLAAVRTALIEIDKRAAEYEASIRDDEVTAGDHAEIAAEMRASLRVARSAAERAARFIRGVKTQTRDISVQEKIRFDPAPVIEDALLLLSFDLRRASCRLDFHPPERSIELLGSPGFLSQVVTNLVTNAVDAMSGAGGTITVGLRGVDGTARLTVQDTGAGIPAEIRDRVFEPMFTTKPYGQGTGLGLAIVHDLVAGQLGGSLELESEIGVGTTFTVVLPLAAVA
jgi:signal transduction histidine kinase